MVAGIAGALDALADAYRSGGGVPYAAYGPMLRHGQAGINRPAFTSDLRSWLAAGSADALLRSRPAPRIADVGCGLGWSTIALATAYPDATVIGYDADRASVIDARAVAADERADVTFHNLRAEDLAGHGPFDVVLMLEMLHDVSNPVAALSACRAALAPGGALVVVDEKVADTFTPPGDEIERFMYGFSVLHCLPASMAEPGSAALGTVLRSDTVRRLASVAGFSSCQVLDVDAGFFRVYELTG
jgi:SAM-dependent methyltransferase